jgi:hypothetical protein
MNWEVKLFNAVTEYDRKQSKEKFYNPYALAHYSRAVAHVRAHVAAGADLRTAILNCFLGRLADVCLKALGLEKMSRDESRFGPAIKLPEIEE